MGLRLAEERKFQGHSHVLLGPGSYGMSFSPTDGVLCHRNLLHLNSDVSDGRYAVN